MSIATTAVAFATFIEYQASSAALRTEFFAHYDTLGKSLTGTFMQLERVSDQAVTNAAQALKLYEAAHGLPTREQLEALAVDLHVSCLGAYDRDGVSEVFGDDPHARGATHLFALCSTYEDQLLHQREVIVTPFAPKANSNSHGKAAEKFAFLASADGQHVLAATLLSSNTATFLQDALRADNNIATVTLWMQNGEQLARVERTPNLSAPRLQPARSPQDLDPANELEASFTFSVPSSIPVCCECQTKGVLADANDTSYRMDLNVSLLPLRAAQRALAWRNLAIFVVAALLSGVISRWFAGRFLRRVQHIADVTEAVLGSGDLSLRATRLEGQDELASLTRNLNRMLESLERSAQAELRRADVEATATLAQQVAHDIRTPAAALQIALSKAAGLDGPVRDVLHDAAQRVTDIANNLLARHAHVPSAQPVALVPLIQSAIAEQRLLLQDRHITFHLDLAAGAEEAAAQLDPRLFRRVCSNLFNNAVEAMGRRGHVFVHVDADSGALWVSIRDTGRGIPPELLQEVLQPGFSYGKSDGHGLGLSGAREALESWGGRLDLESTRGRGTTLRLLIPRAR